MQDHPDLEAVRSIRKRLCRYAAMARRQGEADMAAMFEQQLVLLRSNCDLLFTIKVVVEGYYQCHESNRVIQPELSDDCKNRRKRVTERILMRKFPLPQETTCLFARALGSEIT